MVDNFGSEYMGDFHIGHADGNSRFNGHIKEVNVWNTALNEDQIQENMNSDLIGDETGLVAYWDFRAGDGDIVYDRSDNLNHGTINGATWSEDTPYTGPEWFVSIDGDDSNNDGE